MTKPCRECGTELTIPAGAEKIAAQFEVICTPCTGITEEQLEAAIAADDAE